MSSGCGCGCNSAPKLIFACSGAADVGALADQAARKLARDGKGKMYCLAGVGGRVEPIMQNVKQAGDILAIDGCAMNCVKNTLEQAGFTDYKHLRLAEIGMMKGSTPVNEETIAIAAAKGAELLG